MTIDSRTASGTTTPADAAITEVQRLRDTFRCRRTRSIEWRRAQLRAVVRMLRDNEADITSAIVSDLGRPASDVFITDIAPSIAEAVYATKNLHRWMRPRRTSLPFTGMPGLAKYVYEPLGVVLVVGPWNYPFFLTIAPLVAALAAGNCAVVKPSEHAPASARVITELIHSYLDTDAVTVIEGGADVTQGLIAAGMDHVFFTGGTEIGRAIMRAAAEQLTPVTLELGGKSPVIVLADADITVAARRIAWMKFINAGQTCIAPDYVLVHEAVRDNLIEQLAKAIAVFRAGQPAGLRIVNQRQFERLTSMLVEAGGRLALGGGVDRDQLRIEPSIVVDPRSDGALMTEEIFGPILPVCTVGSLDEAIEHINARAKPLAVAMFGGRRSHRRRVEQETSSGGVVFNHVAVHCLVPQLPFGGVGPSGMGSYHGKWGFAEFSHRKAVLFRPNRPDFSLLYPPYTPKKLSLFRRFF